MPMVVSLFCCVCVNMPKMITGNREEVTYTRALLLLECIGVCCTATHCMHYVMTSTQSDDSVKMCLFEVGALTTVEMAYLHSKLTKYKEYDI